MASSLGTQLDELAAMSHRDTLQPGVQIWSRRFLRAFLGFRARGPSGPGPRCQAPRRSFFLLLLRCVQLGCVWDPYAGQPLEKKTGPLTPAP